MHTSHPILYEVNDKIETAKLSVIVVLQIQLRVFEEMAGCQRWNAHRCGAIKSLACFEKRI